MLSIITTYNLTYYMSMLLCTLSIPESISHMKIEPKICVMMMSGPFLYINRISTMGWAYLGRKCLSKQNNYLEILMPTKTEVTMKTVA